MDGRPPQAVLQAHGHTIPFALPHNARPPFAAAGTRWSTAADGSLDPPAAAASHYLATPNVTQPFDSPSLPGGQFAYACADPVHVPQAGSTAAAAAATKGMDAYGAVTASPVPGGWADGAPGLLPWHPPPPGHELGGSEREVNDGGEKGLSSGSDVDGDDDAAVDDDDDDDDDDHDDHDNNNDDHEEEEEEEDTDASPQPLNSTALGLNFPSSSAPSLDPPGHAAPASSVPLQPSGAADEGGPSATKEPLATTVNGTAGKAVGGNKTVPGAKASLKLSRQDKIAIILEHDAKPSLTQQETATKWKVDRSTISKILHARARWLAPPSPPKPPILVPRKLTTRPEGGRYKRVEAGVNAWLDMRYRQGLSADDRLVREKARQVWETLQEEARKEGTEAKAEDGGGKDGEDKLFKASAKWLGSFKDRRRIAGRLMGPVPPPSFHSSSASPGAYYHPAAPVPDSPASSALSHFSLYFAPPGYSLPQLSHQPPPQHPGQGQDKLSHYLPNHSIPSAGGGGTALTHLSSAPQRAGTSASQGFAIRPSAQGSSATRSAAEIAADGTPAVGETARLVSPFTSTTVILPAPVPTVLQSSAGRAPRRPSGMSRHPTFHPSSEHQAAQDARHAAAVAEAAATAAGGGVADAGALPAAPGRPALGKRAYSTTSVYPHYQMALAGDTSAIGAQRRRLASGYEPRKSPIDGGRRDSCFPSFPLASQPPERPLHQHQHQHLLQHQPPSTDGGGIRAQYSRNSSRTDSWASSSTVPSLFERDALEEERRRSSTTSYSSHQAPSAVENAQGGELPQLYSMAVLPPAPAPMDRYYSGPPGAYHSQPTSPKQQTAAFGAPLPPQGHHQQQQQHQQAQHRAPLYRPSASSLSSASSWSAHPSPSVSPYPTSPAHIEQQHFTDEWHLSAPTTDQQDPHEKQFTQQQQHQHQHQHQHQQQHHPQAREPQHQLGWNQPMPVHLHEPSLELAELKLGTPAGLGAQPLQVGGAGGRADVEGWEGAARWDARGADGEPRLPPHVVYHSHDHHAQHLHNLTSRSAGPQRTAQTDSGFEQAPHQAANQRHQPRYAYDPPQAHPDEHSQPHYQYHHQQHPPPPSPSAYPYQPQHLPAHHYSEALGYTYAHSSTQHQQQRAHHQLSHQRQLEEEDEGYMCD